MRMSRNIRQTAITGLLGSKRFIVSVCAAIAMVLGAVSVGASLFTPGSHADVRRQSANSAVFTERKNSGRSSNNPDPLKVTGGLFTQQHTLQPQGIGTAPIVSTPPATTPKVKGSVGIDFGPIKTGTGLGIVLGQLQVKIDAPVAGVAEAVTPAMPDILPVDVLPDPGVIDTEAVPTETPPPVENTQAPSTMSAQGSESLPAEQSGD